MQSLLEDPVFYNLLLNNQESLLDTSSETTPLPIKDSTHSTSHTSPTDNDVKTKNDPHGLDEDMNQQMAYPGQHIVYSVPHHQHPQPLPQQQHPSDTAMNHQHNFMFQGHHTEPPHRNTNGQYDFQMVQHPHHPMQQIASPNMRYPPQVNRGSNDTTSSYQPSVFSDSMSMGADSVDGMSYHHNSGQPVVDAFFMKEVPHQIRSEIGQSAVSAPQMMNSSSTSAQKRFHRYYTTAPMSSSPANASITHPTTTSPQDSQIMMPSSAPNRDFHVKKPTSSNYHKCPFCQRSFKNKSYLSRHLKKHDTIKDFKCPFFNPKHTKCHHLNGEFSRKDTFKAHLKSIHFIYPIGVAKSDRNDSPGRCAGCFKEFNNNTEWLNEHIETEECDGFAKFKE